MGSPFWLFLTVALQYIGWLFPQVIYWTTTAFNGFRQPSWMKPYALLQPPDVFGVDGEVVGRVVALLGVRIGWAILRGSIEHLGDQYAPAGIREKPRLVDTGPFEYVRHPLYAGATLIQIAFAFAIWSHIPLYTLFFSVLGCVIRIPLEEKSIIDDPVLGEQYKQYQIKVPYMYIPYIW